MIQRNSTKINDGIEARGPEASVEVGQDLSLYTLCERIQLSGNTVGARSN